MDGRTTAGALHTGARVYCAERGPEWGLPSADWSDRAAPERGPHIAIGSRVEYTAQTDEDLVNLISSRDVHALETLYNRHARSVYSLSLKMLAEPAAAEEIVQECFLKLWRQPELYQSGRGKLLSWLLGVTHHRAVDQLRRRRLEQRHTVDGEVDPAASDDANPERHAWGRFRVEAVGRALADLPPSQRATLELAYLRGMTQAEIAACLGEPLGTIKTRMRLAMQKLRAMPELVALVAEPGPFDQ